MFFGHCKFLVRLVDFACLFFGVLLNIGPTLRVCFSDFVLCFLDIAFLCVLFSNFIFCFCVLVDFDVWYNLDVVCWLLCLLVVLIVAFLCFPTGINFRNKLLINLN